MRSPPRSLRNTHRCHQGAARMQALRIASDMTVTGLTLPDLEAWRAWSTPTWRSTSTPSCSRRSSPVSLTISSGTAHPGTAPRPDVGTSCPSPRTQPLPPLLRPRRRRRQDDRGRRMASAFSPSSFATAVTADRSMSASTTAASSSRLAKGLSPPPGTPCHRHWPACRLWPTGLASHARVPGAVSLW